MTAPHRPSRLADFFDSYTKDLTAEDLQRLFTRDTRDAYKFFTRHRDADAMQRLSWHRRTIAETRTLVLAFPVDQPKRTVKLAWQSQAGRLYFLEGSQDLIGWSRYSEPLTGVGGPMRVTLPALDPRLPYFFRVTVRP